MLGREIKNKIKQLLDEKKIKKSRLSLDLGYSKSFVGHVLGSEKRFFNLEHIERICAALNYPVAQLFADVEGEGDLCLAEPPGPPYNPLRRIEDKIQGLKELNQRILALPEDQRQAVIAHANSTIDLFAAAGQANAKKKAG